MKGVECWVDVWNEGLTGKRREEGLCVGPEITRDLAALANADLENEFYYGATDAPSEKLTCFNSPRTSNGKNLRFSLSESCALAPPPPPVIVFL